MKNKNPHIIYILTKLELGGAQKVCLTLLKNFKNCSLISGAEGILVSDVKTDQSVFLIDSFKREVRLLSIFSEIKTFLKMIFKMRSLKKKHPNIIVHTHSTKAGLMGRWSALFSGIKKRVHTVHGFGFHNHQNKIAWLINFTLEFATSLITTHYVCVSKEDRKIGIKLLLNFKKKSSVIRAAVDYEKFYTPAKLDQSKKICQGSIFQETKKNFIIGTVSCLKPQKNIIDLLKAFKLFIDKLSTTESKNIKLQIIGDGIQRKIVEEWISKNKLESKIDLLGWQNDIQKFMNSWDIFAMSSLWEGLPCAIVEARLSKLPVIAYKINGIPEIIQNGKNGFLVKPGNWKLLSQKMEILFKDFDLLKTMKIHPDDLNEFKNTTMIKQHSNLYQKLL